MKAFKQGKNLWRVETDTGLTVWDNVPFLDLASFVHGLEGGLQYCYGNSVKVTNKAIGFSFEFYPESNSVYVRWRGHCVSWVSPDICRESVADLKAAMQEEIE